MLRKKISAISEVESSIEHIQNEFEVIQAVISKANKCLSNDPPYHAWLDGVRDVALKIEDTIDESDRYRIALAPGEENSSSGSIMNQHIMNWSYINDEDEILGNGEEIKALTEWLTNDRRERTVISIFGMGGVGKTTLANSIYKKQQAARYFHCYAWVSVSATYAFEDLLRSITKQLLQKRRKDPQEIDTMDLRQLVDKIKSDLQDKKYLIVLDDVWQSDALRLCHVFPKNDLGSRIIITTHKEDVASIADKNYQIKLNGLLEEASWDLFCKKAFCTIPENRCPEGLTSWEATRDLAENLQKLKLLRRVQFQKVQQCFIPELCASMAMLPDLTTLNINAINNAEVLDLNFLGPLPDLEKLFLRGRMEMGILPRVFDSLHKLRILGLYWSSLNEDPLGSLGLMSNLVFLILTKPITGSC
ncbi:hypothetical protein LUZ63_004131 [Rhynchospora breviuscula]|uniref:NB-ARC domain-containing protein n=1 Tax=Rhynchospora breviuscula TaxID=2022672 RepID=A0A9Q0HZP2_9POAL|nr:hypothetical protein LUZ63_004131 [Rhynchospora breviuscula]